jgi:hypothetical protein
MLKNGSTTLKTLAEKNNYRIYQKQEIYYLQSVDVLIREPRQRYVSGLDIFVWTLKRDNPDLDVPTCVWFANRYSFLNRHYITQFHWLINLARFINPDCLIKFHDFSLLASITNENDKHARDPIDPEIKSVIESYLPHKEFWFFLDDILLGLRGQSLTWKEVLNVFRDHPNDPLKEFITSLEISNALRQT